jgi:LemA protein
MSNIILIIAVAIIIVFCIFVYNSLIQLSNKVKEAFSTMDVYLKQRFDLIPNLVDTVKAYAKHEADTLEELTKRRAGVASNDIDGKIDGEMRIGEALSCILVVVEKYPELKASENFLDLHKRLVKVEEDIAYARRYYNGSVRQYNDKCQMFPYNIIANIFGFRAKKMYEILNAAEREVPNA